VDACVSVSGSKRPGRLLHLRLEFIGDDTRTRLVLHFLAAIAGRERLRKLQSALTVRPPTVLRVVEHGKAAPRHHGLAERRAFEDAFDAGPEESEPRRERAGVGAVQLI